MRILLIDDVNDVLDTMSILLQVEGHSVEACGSAVDALFLLKNNGYDLIITDVLMPKMNGYEFLLAVKKMDNVSSIPVIAMSGGGVSEANRKVLRSMASISDNFLKKPVHPKEIINAVNEISESSLKRTSKCKI